jgi:hypothetical protein
VPPAATVVVRDVRAAASIVAAAVGGLLGRLDAGAPRGFPFATPLLAPEGRSLVLSGRYTPPNAILGGRSAGDDQGIGGLLHRARAAVRDLAESTPLGSLVALGLAGALVLSALLTGAGGLRRRGIDRRTAHFAGFAIPRGELAWILAAAGAAVALAWGVAMYL